jgi:ubiquinone/menaquinone biosynthesis C-methylase UbiE
MEPKPAHLSGDYPRQFSDPSVVAAYVHRAAYPAAVFGQLARLTAPSSRRVLDLGCGTGDIARPLVRLVERVDAVDISAPMIALGKTLPGGDAANLRWIEGPAEYAPLDPPYGLVTAGESLHWMQWSVVLPRIAGVLAPGGVLAIIERKSVYPWDTALLELIVQHSTNRDFRPYSLVDELTRRSLFVPLGEFVSAPVASEQSFADFIESMHSANGFSRDRMSLDAAGEFDRSVAGVLARYADGDTVVRQTSAVVRWGAPTGATV